MYNNPFNRCQIMQPSINWEDMIEAASADIKSNPRLIFTPKHKDWRDIMMLTSPNCIDNIFESLSYEAQNDIYANDREAFDSLSSEAKERFTANRYGNGGQTTLRQQTMTHLKV